MSLFGMSWAIDDDPDWGNGLVSPDPRFPVGAEVVITQTISAPSTVGAYELVVKDEIGRVTREGSRRILVRMERRHRAVSIYLPTECITKLNP